MKLQHGGSISQHHSKAAYTLHHLQRHAQEEQAHTCQVTSRRDILQQDICKGVPNVQERHGSWLRGQSSWQRQFHVNLWHGMRRPSVQEHDTSGTLSCFGCK